MRTHGKTATKFYNLVSNLVQDKDYVLSELGSELGRTFALLGTDTLRFFSISGIWKPCTDMYINYIKTFLLN